MSDIGIKQPLTVVPSQAFSARTAAILPPLFALFYPWAVWNLFSAANAAKAASGMDFFGTLLLALMSLLLCMTPTAVSLLMLFRPVAPNDQFAGTRWIAFLAFTTPALYTVERVYFAAFRSSFDDRYLWSVVWLALVAVAAIGRPRRAARFPAWTGKLRVAHGIGAAVILVTFLVAHLGNHLAALTGTQSHVFIQDILRAWYRNGLVEPLIFALFVFQLASGLALASAYQYTQGDRFRTLQVATGIGLLAFLCAHLTVIFIVARWENNVNTNWVFATGFNLGLLGNSNNARQVPYYIFATMTTFAHLACGLRVVLLGHRWSTVAANKTAIAIIVVGFVIAAAIMSAMLGLRLTGT